MNTELAEEIALKVLNWLVSSETHLPIFLGATGASIDDIRTQAADKTFLNSVLDFVTMDDEWIIECCDQVGLKYEEPSIAKAILSGAADMHWT